MLHAWTAVFKGSAAEGETANATITTPPCTEDSVSKEDESGNLQMTPTKEPKRLQYPPREPTNSNLKFPSRISSTH
jgi:hypothetical protein